MSNSSEPGDSLSALDPNRLPAEYPRVTFYPSIDDLAYGAQRMSKGYKFPPRAQYAMQAFLVLNMIGLPAVLWYFGEPLAAIAVILLSLVFASLFVPALLKADFRHYFSMMYGRMEDDVAEVVLTDEGIWCRHQSNQSFHAWKTVKGLEETKTAIHFFLNYSVLTVAKTGFAYDDKKNRFLEFAKKRVGTFDVA